MSRLKCWHICTNSAGRNRKEWNELLEITNTESGMWVVVLAWVKTIIQGIANGTHKQEYKKCLLQRPSYKGERTGVGEVRTPIF